jgi:baculoviral IAP repeat-containing protein 6
MASPAPAGNEAASAAMREARDAAKLSLESDGILIRFDPNDLRTAYVCLVGPEGTPYEHCIFLFKFVLAANHPAAPPQATYLTNNGTTRFNPNLYTCGKVCLSVLGTWNGPSWVPATLECLGQTIRSAVLTDTPLRCEPCYERSGIADIAPYSLFVECHSLNFALEQAIKSPPDGFTEFKPQITKYFLDHIDFYMSKLEWLSSKSEGATIGHSYAGQVVACYGGTGAKLQALYRELSGTEWTRKEGATFDPGKRHWYNAMPARK